MPRPPVKKTFKLAKAKRLGELKAEQEFLAKALKNKKGRLLLLKDISIEWLHKVDPLKLSVILLTAYFIKNGIEWAENVLSAGVGGTPLETLYRLGLGVIGLLIPKGEEAQRNEELVSKAMDTPQVEILEWGLSFAVAYLIVEHGGELIKAGGDILSVGKGLLGVLAL